MAQRRVHWSAFNVNVKLFGVMTSPDKDTLAARTGQNRKLILGIPMFLIGAVSVLIASVVLKTTSDLFGLLWVGGFALAVARVVILTVLIRCPICRCRFIWKGMRSMPVEI
jgi:hypothetical protein